MGNVDKRWVREMIMPILIKKFGLILAVYTGIWGWSVLTQCMCCRRWQNCWWCQWWYQYCLQSHYCLQCHYCSQMSVLLAMSLLLSVLLDMLVLLTMSVLLAIRCKAYEVNSDYLFIFDHTEIFYCIEKYCHLFVFLYRGFLSEVRGFIQPTCWEAASKQLVGWWGLLREGCSERQVIFW